MTTKITTTTIKKDGTTTTTTRTRRKKCPVPVIDNTKYTDYRQCCHAFGVRVATVCRDFINTIDQVTGYFPLGEHNSKLLAIRHVMDRTACFSRNLTMSAITGNNEIPAEDSIDF